MICLNDKCVWWTVIFATFPVSSASVLIASVEACISTHHWLKHPVPLPPGKSLKQNYTLIHVHKDRKVLFKDQLTSSSASSCSLVYERWKYMILISTLIYFKHFVQLSKPIVLCKNNQNKQFIYRLSSNINSLKSSWHNFHELLCWNLKQRLLYMVWKSLMLFIVTLNTAALKRSWLSHLRYVVL